MENELMTVETFDISVVEAQDRALIDKQIATAKQYPRNIQRAKANIVAIAAMDEDTAKSCGYSLPRGGKNISGPSVHLARIIIQQYGNVRVDSKVVEEGATSITAQSTCIDLENNVGIRVEVKRKITDKYGKRYNDDMIIMTGNAAAAIALRNAVYNVVPKPLIDAGYKAAQEKIVGKISNETDLLTKRKKLLDEFQSNYGVDEKAILKAMGLREITQIKVPELKILIGLWQAIKDGETTVDETFYPEKVKENGDSNSTGVTIDALQTLFDFKRKTLTKEEVQNAERIISNKEVASYQKLYKLLDAK